MTLLVSIITAPELMSVSQKSMKFDVAGGTLGRGEENTWVLDDPELYLSSLHCQISHENNDYFLIDQSTNGTFYNGSIDPIGRGSKVMIGDGDRFIIGDYEFSIQVQSVQTNDFLSNPAGHSDDSFSDDPFKSVDTFSANPFESSSMPGQAPIFPTTNEESDPLAALDRARGGSFSEASATNSQLSNDPFAAPTFSDGASPINQQIDWPQPVAQSATHVIPDDWDEDLMGSSTITPDKALSAEDINRSGAQTFGQIDDRPAIQSFSGSDQETRDLREKLKILERVNQKLVTEIDTLKFKLSTQKNVAVNQTEVDASFVKTLGLDMSLLTDSDIEDINKLTGEVMREMVSGMMQILSSRSAIKNEFRMNVTTIQPVENNPLKFSPDVDEALVNMFVKKGKAYKQPLEAVRDGFEDVAEHQVAILAGIREAFKSVFERFDPITLEERFTKLNKGGFLPGSQKAKNWDAYVDYYNELAGDIDKAFQYLFGDGFVRAYEEQLQKLAIQKKSNLHKRDE